MCLYDSIHTLFGIDNKFIPALAKLVSEAVASAAISKPQDRTWIHAPAVAAPEGAQLPDEEVVQEAGTAEAVATADNTTLDTAPPPSWLAHLTAI